MSDQTLAQLLDRAHSCAAESRWPEAKGILVEAVRHAEQRFGPDAEELVEPLMRLGKAVRSESKAASAVEEAFAYQSRALSIAEKCFAELDPRLDSVLIRVAMTCEERHRFEEAQHHLIRALDVQRQRGADVGFVLVNLVHVLLRAGLPRDALPYAQEALAVAERQARSEDDLIGPLLDMGLALRDSGLRKEALAVLQRAHSIAVARADAPELREARRELEDEVRAWIEDLAGSLDRDG